MSQHPLLVAVIGEAARRELPATIGAECSNLAARLCFSPRLECGERRQCLILRCQQHEPHIATHVVNQQEEIPLASRCRRRHRTTKVPVHQLQLLLRAKLGHSQECGTPLLPGEAAISHLIDMIDMRQPLHQLTLRQPFESVEIQMAIP
jgi:hypothetical protein